MPLLQTEAEKLSRSSLEAGVIEQIIDKEELFAIMPFMRVEGKAYLYVRENSLASADFVSPNDTINEGASDFTEVTAKLKILAGDLDLDKFLLETMSDTNSQLATQIAAKAKGVAQKFRQTLATGDTGSNAKAFDGIAVMAAACPSSQQVSAGTNGGALTLAFMDQLADAVPNGADVFMMRVSTMRAYRQILRATSGTNAVMQMNQNFGKPMLEHNGIPIIVNDFLPADETKGTNSATCSIYALRMNEVDGLHGIYGGASAGIRIENLGTVQNKDAIRIRLKWYASVCLKSTRSIARLSGITNI